MAIITASNYKASRGISGSSYDARIALGIAWAESEARHWCGRSETNGFESAARTEVYSGTGTDVLYLNEWPVSAVASVKYVSGSTAGVADWGEALDGSSYRIGERGRLVLSAAGGWSPNDDIARPRWADGTDNIQIVYTGGYSTMPGRLVEACYRLVDYWYQHAGRGDVGSTSMSLGVVNMVRANTDERVAEIIEMLSPWRREY